MSNDQSIEETLDVIRRALEDDNPSLDLKEDLLILNRKVNDDGTINIINNDSINKEDVRKILDEKINQILEKHFDQWLEKKLPYYIKNYLEKK